MANVQPKSISLTQGATFNVLGAPTRMILSRRDTGDSFTMFEQSGPPGTGVPMHVHTREDEVFRVLEGRLRFRVGDSIIEANPGDTLYGPRSVKHEWFVIGDKPGRVLITVLPGTGFEDMLVELSKMPAGPPDMAKVLAICTKAGISFA